MADNGMAFGAPGIEPRWTRSAKEGIGTAYHTGCRLWFTLSHGIINELYYPNVDCPNTRDLQLLVTDGETFCHEERRDLEHRLEYPEKSTLCYRLINSDPQGRYRIIKEVITDPHVSVLLMSAHLEILDERLRGKLRAYALLALPFAQHRNSYVKQWQRTLPSPDSDLSGHTGEGGGLYRLSRLILLAHEDKVYPGALVASMSIPWGETKGDTDLGGYHLVWTRDMVKSACALLASGQTSTPLRSLICLACVQAPDGLLPQNSWINGDAYWHGKQLDEVAAPILLAWRLHQANALGLFDPWTVILRAARYLILHSPVTGQERWEENSGYSPSTLAWVIAGLVCGAEFVRQRADEKTAAFILDYADWLSSHLEEWTVTTRGELVPGKPKHYIRINPADPDQPHVLSHPDSATLHIANGGGAHPARNIVSADFLELVRLG